MVSARIVDSQTALRPSAGVPEPARWRDTPTLSPEKATAKQLPQDCVRAMLTLCKPAKAAAARAESRSRPVARSMKSAIAATSSSRNTGSVFAGDRVVGGDRARYADRSPRAARVSLASSRRVSILRVRLALVALDQHEVARRQPRQDRRRASARPRRAIRASAPSACPRRPRLRWRRPGGGESCRRPRGRCRNHGAHA